MGTGTTGYTRQWNYRPDCAVIRSSLDETMSCYDAQSPLVALVLNLWKLQPDSLEMTSIEYQGCYDVIAVFR